ncbi:hypothetical protein [Mycoplasmopsis fermentans]|nr:hypothetical protein [Mycoplasmopsis fermentans]RMX34914.1 hypothetical protein MFI1_0681 [Mycoplasmopsis fermentans MF-I1]RMX34968.1 hypothetical protein MFI2_0660 [Mycoplasmopsis fermentans MF-I2]VEU63718.1 Uncharacterised protein [Mycoplasmopsis fermentans]VEU67293.1 Uncharacterised protein [Mesomycoplasma conjunctivae]
MEVKGYTYLATSMMWLFYSKFKSDAFTPFLLFIFSKIVLSLFNNNSILNLSYGKDYFIENIDNPKFLKI